MISINKVSLRRARLVLEWVTLSGVQLLVWENLSQYVYNQPPRSTQPGHPSVGRRNEYQVKLRDPLAIMGHLSALAMGSLAIQVSDYFYSYSYQRVSRPSLGRPTVFPYFKYTLDGVYCILCSFCTKKLYAVQRGKGSGRFLEAM